MCVEEMLKSESFLLCESLPPVPASFCFLSDQHCWSCYWRNACIFNTLICLFLLDFHFWQQTNTPSQCWYNCSRNSLRVYALNTTTFSLTLIAISLIRMSRFINEIYLTQVPAWCGSFKVVEMQFLESLWAISLQIRPQRVEGLTMRLEYDRMTLVSSVSKLILYASFSVNPIWCRGLDNPRIK